MRAIKSFLRKGQQSTETPLSHQPTICGIDTVDSTKNSTSSEQQEEMNLSQTLSGQPSNTIPSIKMSFIGATPTIDSANPKKSGKSVLKLASVDCSNNANANISFKSNQQASLDQQNLKPAKQNTGPIRRYETAKVFDENANRTGLKIKQPFCKTPTKLLMPEPSFFGQRSPQLSPLKSKAFSLSNVNKSKSLSVGDIIEGWSFKYPQQRTTHGKHSSKHHTENILQTVECSETYNPIKKNTDEANKLNAEERYPKSLYISPFFIASRRPIRTKQQK